MAHRSLTAFHEAYGRYGLNGFVELALMNALETRSTKAHRSWSFTGRVTIAGLFVLFSGLIASAQFNVVVAPGNQPPYCGQEIITLMVSGVPCGPGSSVQWSTTNGTPGPGGSNPANPCQFTSVFGVGCWDVTVTIDGTTYPVVQGVFCVNPFPIASFTVSETAICEAGCITFTDISTPVGEIDSWTWAGLPCPEAGLGAGQFTCCFPDAGTYWPGLTVFANGCPDAVLDSIMIVVSDTYPTAAFTPTSILDCPGPLDLTLINASAPQSLTSSWELTDGFGAVACDGTATDLNCPGLPTGEYEACLTVTNAGGCSDVVCHPVTIFDSPTLGITFDPSPTCANVPVTFSAVGTLPASPTLVQWDVDCDGSIEGVGLDWPHTFPTAGTYQICVRVEYSSTCFADTILSIEVFDPLVADFTPGDTTVCHAPIALSFDGLPIGSGVLTYSWRVNGVLQSTDEDFAWTFNSSSTVQLVVTNDMGCTATHSATITIDTPDLQLTNIPFGVCAGQLISPDFNLNIIPNQGPYTYSWDFDGGGEDSNLAGPTWAYPPVAVTTTYTICLTITTPTGCTVMDCQDIQVSPALDAGFGLVPQALCAGAGVHLDADNPDGTSYTWCFGDNWCVTTTDPFVNYMYNDTGCFDVTLTISNLGCTADSTIGDAICIWGPIADFSISQTCTAPFEVSFTNLSLFDDSLFWDFGDGTLILAGDSADDAPDIHNPVHVYANEGTYTVCLTAAADTSTCPHTRCFEVYIDQPSANLSFTPTTGCPPLCVVFSTAELYNVEWAIDFGNGDMLSANAIPCDPFDDIDECVTWLVSFTDSPSPADNYSVPFVGGNIFPPCVNYENSGAYTITAIATNINGCTATTVYVDTITISTAPDFATFTYQVTNPCGPYCVDLTADNAMSSYQWSYRLNPWGAWITIPGNNSENALCLGAPPGFLEVQLAGDQGTCSDTQTLNIVFPSVAVASFNISDDTPCQEQVVQFTEQTGASGTGHAWTIDGVSVPGGTTMGHVFADNGIYEVCLSLVDAQYGCPTTICQTVEVYTPEPSVEVTLTPLGCNFIMQACDTNTAPGNTYSYTLLRIYPLPALQVVLSSNSSNPCASTILPAGIYDLAIAVNGPGGFSNCTAIDTIHDLLGLGEILGPWTWTPIDLVNCAPYCVHFEVFNPLAAGVTYLWDFGDGSGGNGPTPDHCYSSPGTYCPTLQVVFPNQCDAFFPCTDSIVVLPYEVSVTYDPIICAGDTSWAEFIATAPFSIDNITFDPGNGVVTGPPWNFGLSPGSSTQYIATSQYHQCSDRDTLEVIVNPLPELTAEPYGPFCINAGDLSDLVVGPLAPPGVSGWDFPVGYPSPLGMGTACDTITYTYTDMLGCTNSIPIPFCILDTTDVTFDSIHVCIDAPPFDLTPYIDFPGGTFQALYNGSVWTALPTLFDPADVIPQPFAAQEVPIRYLYTNGDGCTSINDSVLTIHPLPDLFITAPEVCAYDPLVIDNNSVIPSGAISTWAWSITGQTPPILTTEQVGPFLYPAGPQAILITLDAVSDRGCTAHLDHNALIHPVPVADFTVADGCQWDEFQYADLSSIEGGGPFTWAWLFGDGAPSTDQNPLHPWEVWGPFTDRLIVTSTIGNCADTTTHSITIHPAPVNSMSFAPNCYEEITPIVCTATIPMGSIDSTWWEVGSIPTPYNGPSINHLFPAPGLHEITLYTASDQGCITELTETVVIWPLPAVNYNVSDLVSCVNDLVEFTDASTIPEPYANVAWEWFINGLSVDSAQNLALSFVEPGSYDVGLVVTSGNACIDTLSSVGQIIINPLPVAGFYPSPMRTGILEPEIQFTDTAQGAVQWAYQFGDGHASILQHPQHLYGTFGTYVIQQIVTNVFGCLDTAYQEVIIDPDLLIYVPNAFSPNGDGVNDVFLPSLDGFAVREYNLTIWNRWGELIFETDDERQAWDGSLDGQEVQDGVYVWQVELHAYDFVGRKRLRGHVTVLR